MRVSSAPRFICQAIVCVALVHCATMFAAAQTLPLGPRVADAAMERWPGGHIAPRDAPVAWGFEPGILLTGVQALWTATNNQAYFDYIQHAIDQFVQPDGSIRTYDPKAYALNNILMGRQLLMLYHVTKDERYRKAAGVLHQQLATQPRTASGGFWHAQATPNLMLLDDEFMVAPFAAEYAVTFHQPKDLAAIANQFVLLDRHTRNPKNGLLYHAWDESHHAAWADPATGASANPWARGMGWYMMALADTLPYYPAGDPNRALLLEIFRRTAAAIVANQDRATSFWYQILDRPGQSENYVESSSVLMLNYALAKGVRLGYLPGHYRTNADRAWRAIQGRFVQTTAAGAVSITGTVTHIAMGAAPENDGSYGYYLHAPIVSDDPKGIGAFLLTAAEMEIIKPAHR
jgi:unsaturated rhamnogalacturonyl hydrolase